MFSCRHVGSVQRQRRGSPWTTARHRRMRRWRAMPACESLEDRKPFCRRGQAAEHAPLPCSVEPQAGRAPIINAIDAARSTIRLGICNISDPEIGDSLAAAEARGVKVEVIVDQADYNAKPPEQVEVCPRCWPGALLSMIEQIRRLSAECFATKELVIDQSRVLIMTECDLIPADIRGHARRGLILADKATIREVTSVFDPDWTYSTSTTPPSTPTPPLHDLPPRFSSDRRDVKAVEPDRIGQAHDRRDQRVARRPLPRRPARRQGP